MKAKLKGVVVILMLVLTVLILNAGATVNPLGSDGNPGNGVNTSLGNNITEFTWINQSLEFLNFTLNDSAGNISQVHLGFPSQFQLPVNDTNNYTLSGFIGVDGNNVTYDVSGTVVHIMNSTPTVEIWNSSISPYFSINISNITITSYGTYPINVTTNQTPGGKIIYLTVDGGPSVVANTPTAAQYIWVKNGTTLSLNATITDIGSGVNPSAVFVNTSGVNISIPTTILSKDVNTGYWTNNSIIVSAGNGPRSMFINASDNASQFNNSSYFMVWVDNIPPYVFWPLIKPKMPLYQTDYTNFTNTSSIPVNVSINDSWGYIRMVWCEITNNTGAHILNYTLKNTSIQAPSGYYYNGTIPGNFTLLPPGPYNITVYVYDGAGNLNISAPSPFVLNAVNISQVEDFINTKAAGVFTVNFTYPNDTELPITADFVPDAGQIYNLKINVSGTYLTVVNFSAADFGKANQLDASNTGINTTEIENVGLNVTEKVWLGLGEFINETWYEYGIIRFAGTNHTGIYYINGTMSSPQWNLVTETCNKTDMETGIDNVTNHGGYCYNESDGYTYLYVTHFSGGAAVDDTVPPSVVPVSPVGQWVNNGTVLHLSALITDFSGVKNASVDVSSINTAVSTAILNNLAGDYWTNDSITVMAAAGSYNLTITAYDKNTTPNVNNSVNLTINVDNAAPVIYNLSLSTTSPSYGQSITVSVNASDDNIVSKVTADGVELTHQSGTLWNGTITAGYGTNTVTVIVYDAAGNSITNTSLSYTGPPAPRKEMGGLPNWYYYFGTPTPTPTGTAPVEATATPVPTKKTGPGTTATPAVTPAEATPTPEKTKGIPGFEAVILTAGLLAMAYLLMRKRG